MSRVARVVPDVSGIEGEFDYIVPAKFDPFVDVGTIVRVNFHNRRVRAWVIDSNSIPPPGMRLLELEHITGRGPDQELIDLAAWAAWRWAGKRSFFLQTASPPRVVPPVDSPSRAVPQSSHDRIEEVLRIPPARSPLHEVLRADKPVLLITPTQRSADGWVRRLRSESMRVAQYPDQWAQAADGNVDYVVGTRAAAWAPMPRLATAIVADSHDEGLVSEASPTWSAVAVVAERARRRNARVQLISSVPRVEQLRGRRLVTVPRDEERAGWAPLVVVDQRGSDPRRGLYSPPVVDLVRSNKNVVLVLNRKGRSQLLVCSNCDEVARCLNCEGAQSQHDDQLLCSRCRLTQPVVCRHCNSTKFKQLRVGVQRVREDLESLALKAVGEVTGETSSLPNTDVIIGTEAVLYRVQHTDAVIFLDFDQDLLAPRYRAPEDALLLIARASRLVGGHARQGVVVIQTRQPNHEVVGAAIHGDPARFTELETRRRAEMNWPPNSVLARVSGTAAATYVKGLEGVDVLALDAKTSLIQARNHEVLCDALARVKRPKTGSLRVEVDPGRL